MFAPIAIFSPARHFSVAVMVEERRSEPAATVSPYKQLPELLTRFRSFLKISIYGVWFRIKDIGCWV